ncbi:MAG: sugar transferase [Xanthomonadales bacterium]|nr:sugar transferase [Xanthomonadales bacterium]
MQRFFDLVFSALALLVLLPLLLPVMMLLRLTGEGEVFYRQSRIGRGGTPFGLLKFATMLKDSPNLGTGTVTLHGDPRVLPVGKFLRATKLNELPQLLNILKGDMSLIGPRPQTQRCFDAFPEAAQREIVKVRPGLSGIGSIVFRDEARLMADADDADAVYDGLIMPYKGALEQWYVRRRGLRLYFVLMALTVWVVLRPGSEVIYRMFKDLPGPPPALANMLLQARAADPHPGRQGH